MQTFQSQRLIQSFPAAICGLLIAVLSATSWAEGFYLQTPQPPNIPGNNFKLTDFGGVGDGKTLNTAAFAKAIEACKKGGGIVRATERGADAVLLLSSDLPLVTKKSVRELLAVAGRFAPPVAVAVPATGRGGTNALYLHPPHAIGLHFGADSLAAFRREARSAGVRFEIHISAGMALDLDEPADLVRLRRAV